VQRAKCLVIVTLAMMEVLRGLVFITSNGDAVMISGVLAGVLIMGSVQDAIGLLNVPTF
jgi:ribose/xylose/arabinose/galactoside ABC-type transport system permease subunit